MPVLTDMKIKKRNKEYEVMSKMNLLMGLSRILSNGPTNQIRTRP